VEGARLGRERALDVVGRIAVVVGVPVGAVIESGYAPDAWASPTPCAVAVNIEDAPYDTRGEPLRLIDWEPEWIAAARSAADTEGM
jgi:2-methylisocitrate lyase-like PEP mutase family enzyme